MAAVILAGGRGYRMGGGDKPLLDLGGIPMLARIVAAVEPEVSAVALSANGDPARFARFGLPVLADEPGFAGQGPLAGLLAGLDWAAGRGADLVLTVPGDTPFLPPGLAAALAPANAYAACDGRDHPLAALWRTGCRGRLRAWLGAQPGRSVAAFARTEQAARRTFPPDRRDWFFNVNTPEDLASARDMLAKAT